MGRSGNRGVDAQEQGEGGGFRSRGEECGYRRGRTFVDIGGPNLEGSQRDLKAETNQDQGEAELQERAGRIDGGHGGEKGGGRDSVDQGGGIGGERGGGRADEGGRHGG